MRWKMITGLFFLFMFIPAICYGNEMYTSVFVDGKAPVIIDGDLSDWDWVTVVPIQIDKLRDSKKPETPVIGKVFSATFQCFIDESNLYAAFIVSDDRVVFGNAKNGKPFWDDAVEIVLFGNQGISPTGRPDVAKIWVSADSQGKTKIEGREPQSLDPNYPYLKREWGIKAALSQTEKGYTVEISIPLKVLSEWAEWEKSQSLKLNVRAYDDNSKLDEFYLEWAENTYELPGNNFNEIVFTEKAPQQDVHSDSQENEQSNVSEIEIILNEPDKTGDLDDSDIQELKADIDVAISLEKSRLYGKAIEELENIVQVCPPGNIQCKAKLALARNCYFINDFDRSKKLCEELLTSELDSKTDLDTRMILLSIERKYKSK